MEDDLLIDTIYEGERYAVPYEEIGSWFSYMKALSLVQLDAGNRAIAFTDKFHKYRL